MTSGEHSGTGEDARNEKPVGRFSPASDPTQAGPGDPIDGTGFSSAALRRVCLERRFQRPFGYGAPHGPVQPLVGRPRAEPGGGRVVWTRGHGSPLARPSFPASTARSLLASASTEPLATLALLPLVTPCRLTLASPEGSSGGGQARHDLLLERQPPGAQVNDGSRLLQHAQGRGGEPVRSPAEGQPRDDSRRQALVRRQRLLPQQPPHGLLVAFGGGVEPRGGCHDEGQTLAPTLPWAWWALTALSSLIASPPG